MITLPAANLVVSFVISTYNRRDVLLATLARMRQCGLSRDAFEIMVVDNASRDGTASAVAADFPEVRLFALPENRGSCAKNVALERAGGRYVVFLDDDSYPMSGSIARMIHHFDSDPTLGAAAFTVTLPDGSRECSAYPDVFIGCGTGFRRSALLQVGALPEDFFMQAEEYDLSFRLLDAGWDVRTFDDLHVTHLKTPNARRSWRTMRLDVRNNFVVATRYIPDRWATQFTLEWMRRYYRIARTKRQRTAFFAGLIQGVHRSMRTDHRRPVSDEVFDRFARIDEIEQRMRAEVDKLGLWSVLFVDLGKNLLPYWIAAQKCGLKVVGIADKRLCGTGKYRGVPVVNDAVARRLDFDAVIVSNLSPVHAEARAQEWRRLDDRPVIDLFESRCASDRLEIARVASQVARQRAA
jgi:GT2 family glycosyltransferase